MEETDNIPAGWYPEPNTGAPRWWDGQQWVMPERWDGMAIASLVFGVVSVLLAGLVWIPLGCGLTGLALSLGALKHTHVRGRGMAVGGLITAIVGILFSVAFIFYRFVLV